MSLSSQIKTFFEKLKSLSEQMHQVPVYCFSKKATFGRFRGTICCVRFKLLRYRPGLRNVWFLLISTFKASFLRSNRPDFCRNLSQYSAICRKIFVIEVRRRQNLAFRKVTILLKIYQTVHFLNQIPNLIPFEIACAVSSLNFSL